MVRAHSRANWEKSTGGSGQCPGGAGSALGWRPSAATERRPARPPSGPRVGRSPQRAPLRPGSPTLREEGRERGLSRSCGDRIPSCRFSPLKSPVSATTVVWCLSCSSADSIFCRSTGDTDTSAAPGDSRAHEGRYVPEGHRPARSRRPPPIPAWLGGSGQSGARTGDGGGREEPRRGSGRESDSDWLVREGRAGVRLGDRGAAIVPSGAYRGGLLAPRSLGPGTSCPRSLRVARTPGSLPRGRYGVRPAPEPPVPHGRAGPGRGRCRKVAAGSP